MEKNDVYLISAKRTPIGRFQGVLKEVSAPYLGAAAVSAALSASGVSPQCVDGLIMGQVLTAGVGQSPARQTALFAGLPQNVPALTVGKVCGSGLQAVILAVQSLLVGDARLLLAGGQESMSQAPYLIPQARAGLRLGHKELCDSLILDGLWDPYGNLHMGSCAEICVKQYGFTRQIQDDFAFESYTRARHALAQNLFVPEIAPVFVQKTKTTVSVDEEPTSADLAKMPQLSPAFAKDGTITVGNAAKINDGAAAVVVASYDAVQEHNLKPMAKIVSWAGHAQEPQWFTTAPVVAMQKALAKASLSVGDIDLYEVNEAFAVVGLVAMQDLGVSREKLNVRGGACSLGHPIGASGARILTTLLHALQQENKRYGLASLCIGGGEALAMVVERI